MIAIHLNEKIALNLLSQLNKGQNDLFFMFLKHPFLYNEYMNKTLIFIRHFHAANALPDQKDMERPLSKQGIATCLDSTNAIARFIHDPNDARILVSPATRTQMTAEIIANATKIKQVVIEPAIYQGPIEDVIHAIDQAFFKANTVMVVGHFPDIISYVEYYTDAVLPFGIGACALVDYNSTKPTQSQLELYANPMNLNQIKKGTYENI